MGIAAKAKLSLNFLERKREEYEQLKCEIEALQQEMNILSTMDSNPVSVMKSSEVVVTR